jgi:hypothetical protein
MDAHLAAGSIDAISLLESFSAKLTADLTTAARDPFVVAFKSAVCYRTGLAVALSAEWESLYEAVGRLAERYQDDKGKALRLEHKPLNDLVVRIAMEVGGKYGLPG